MICVTHLPQSRPWRWDLLFPLLVLEEIRDLEESIRTTGEVEVTEGTIPRNPWRVDAPVSEGSDGAPSVEGKVGNR